MDKWTHKLTRLDPHGDPQRCQEDKCSVERAAYRVVATRGGSTAGRNYCLQHAAASCYRLGLSFPMGKK